MTKLTDLKTPEDWLNEAKRYLENAREILKKANLDYKYNIYKDVKYVRDACGVGYLAAEMAIESYLMHRGMPLKLEQLKKKMKKGKVKERVERVSFQKYVQYLSRLNKGLKNKFEDVYQVLHLDGYYDGINDKNVIQAGLKSVEEIIKMVERNITKK